MKFKRFRLERFGILSLGLESEVIQKQWKDRTAVAMGLALDIDPVDTFMNLIKNTSDILCKARNNGQDDL